MSLPAGSRRLRELAGPGSIGGLPLDKLVETAVVHVLMQESQIVVVENLEELVPAYTLQPGILAAVGIVEVDPNHRPAAAVMGGVLDDRWMTATLLHPFADLVVIGGRGCASLGLAHRSISRIALSS